MEGRGCDWLRGGAGIGPLPLVSLSIHFSRIFLPQFSPFIHFLRLLYYYYGIILFYPVHFLTLPCAFSFTRVVIVHDDMAHVAHFLSNNVLFILFYSLRLFNSKCLAYLFVYIKHKKYTVHLIHLVSYIYIV